MIITTWLVATVLAVPAFSAQSSDAAFAAAVSGARAQMTASFASTSWNEERALLDLLRDPSAEVRLQAVRSLKAWVSQRISTRDAVLDVYLNPNENLSVRREAAKSLSVVTTYPAVHNALLDYAKRGSDSGLRAISYKALYWEAANRPTVRNDLLDAARREPVAEVRHAAIWALFATNDNRVKDGLLDIARRDLDAAARVEALKSSYGLMGYNETRDLAFDLARDPNTNAQVRRAAILLHSNRVTTSQKDMLEDIARSDRDPAMRTAAIVALGNPRSDELVKYFHLVRRDHNNVMIGDPLDAE